MTYKILHGNNLDILPTLPDNSVDSIVTDPPYELGFMGKKWDSSGIAYSVELWQQCLRVLKPGGHLLSFGGTRTYHRVAVAIEDAGFELRDSIAWLYGSGFPKSLDVSKAIDKAAGAEHLREFVSTNPANRPYNMTAGETSTGWQSPPRPDKTAPATTEAQQWEGWGTALKPAFEPVIVARKPIEGTVANNVLKWGTGGLNIDGSRIGTTDSLYRASSVAMPENQEMNEVWKEKCKQDPNWVAEANKKTQEKSAHADKLGRWPANIILDPYTAELLDEQSGQVKGNPGAKQTTDFRFMNDADGKQNLIQGDRKDIGGASRFFYVAKASKRDRNEGLEELGDVMTKRYGEMGQGDTPQQTPRVDAPQKNFHPTVKPTSLMEYLIKLVTPPNGTVLDPFTGSGSTGKAAILQGFDFIGIEMTEEYLPIIEGRLKHAERIVAERNKEASLLEQEKLF
jgi:DNA modification methylase